MTRVFITAFWWDLVFSKALYWEVFFLRHFTEMFLFSLRFTVFFFHSISLKYPFFTAIYKLFFKDFIFISTGNVLNFCHFKFKLHPYNIKWVIKLSFNNNGCPFNFECIFSLFVNWFDKNVHLFMVLSSFTNRKKSQSAISGDLGGWVIISNLIDSDPEIIHNHYLMQNTYLDSEKTVFKLLSIKPTLTSEIWWSKIISNLSFLKYLIFRHVHNYPFNHILLTQNQWREIR